MRSIGLLLRKDLRILARSPVLVAALIIYPLVFAALVGAVVRYAGDRPTIAFVDLDRLPEKLTVGGQTFNVPAVGTGNSSTQHPASTAHSVAANAKNNHIFVPLGANNAFSAFAVPNGGAVPDCETGCIAVFGHPDED